MEEFLSYLFEGVYVVNNQRKILFWNSGAEIITGYDADEVVNSFCFHNILQHVDESGKELCFGGCPLHNTLNTGNHNEASVFLRHKDGHRIPVGVRTIPLYDDEGNISAAVEVFHDKRLNTTLLEENRELKNLVTHDELTGVYNRRYVKYQLKSSLKEKKEFDIQFGLLFIDIDYFKRINDTFGHDIGDQVLKLVSKTIAQNIRSGDFIGRWGGEEFIVLLRNMDNYKLKKIAEKLRILVQKSRLYVDNEIVSVTISIGASLHQGEEELDSWIKRADKLMYRAKKTGRNKVCINLKECAE